VYAINVVFLLATLLTFGSLSDHVGRRPLILAAGHNTALVLPAHFVGHSALEIARRGDTYAVRQWAPLPTYPNP
jgi:hypothetical protein